MTAALIIGIVAIICLSATVVAVTVTFRQALSAVHLQLDLTTSRADDRTEMLLNRLAAINWEDYASLRSLTETTSDEGGFFTPEEQKGGEVLIETPGQWGSLRRLRDSLSADERQLLDEDFDESDFPIRQLEED